jgi:hypothetical protein
MIGRPLRTLEDAPEPNCFLGGSGRRQGRLGGHLMPSAGPTLKCVPSEQHRHDKSELKVEASGLRLATVMAYRWLPPRVQNDRFNRRARCRYGIASL